MAAPNGAPDLRLVMQARQISEQQRQAIQIQQQGQNNQIHNSPPNMRASINMNGINQQAFLQNNQAMMAAFNAGSINGNGTPPANGLNIPSVPAGSPRMGHPGQPQQPNGSVSQISKLESQFRAQFPTASPEQVKKMVQDTLSQNLAVQRQSAMHAAAGSGTSLTGMLGGIQNSPQQYAQMLRAQQERQAAATSQQPRSSSAGSGSGIGK
jgi:chromatin modification-related protein VID21